MAAADYKLCDVCSAKTFYDVEIDYADAAPPDWTPIPKHVGSWAVICESCAKTHICVVMERANLNLQQGEEKL